MDVIAIPYPFAQTNKCTHTCINDVSLDDLCSPSFIHSSIHCFKKNHVQVLSTVTTLLR